MKRKQYYKYKTIAKKVYDLELILTLGGTSMGGCTLPDPTDHIRRKHLKIRSRYNRLIRNNPCFNEMVWSEIYAELKADQC
mgnify:CR=1 FL=1